MWRPRSTNMGIFDCADDVKIENEIVTFHDQATKDLADWVVTYTQINTYTPTLLLLPHLT